ncbi:MAG: hypothetical protein EBZ59_00395 [Planctomycetia bacterium]|nr:hypothetical protein [Planctomycetia bacterium]
MGAVRRIRSVMKFRSCLLFACMIVVPLLAMFSHRIPPEFRQAVRDRAWEPARRSLAAALDVESPAAASRDGFPPQPTAAVVANPADEPARVDVAGTPQAPGGLRDDLTGGLRVAGPAVAPATVSSPSAVATEEVRTRRNVEDRLAALGAISFDCQPLQGGEGIHRCSCRMAADPTGQLQRVFQSSGPDPISAMTSLLDQVTTWKERVAIQQDERTSRDRIRF